VGQEQRANDGSHVDVAEALRAADAICDARHVKLTPLRRSVLEALWRIGKPVGAYRLLERLQVDWGHRVAPTTVYRAIDFLLAQGLAARIESRNAYVPCMGGDPSLGSAFLICDQCGGSAEVENPEIEDLFARDAERRGFRVEKRVVEVHGSCASCLGASEP